MYELPNGRDYGRVIGWLIVIASILVAAVWIGTAGAWLTKPAEIIHPDNVQREYDWFYSTRRSLMAKQNNIVAFHNQIENVQVQQQSKYGEDQGRWEQTAHDRISQLSQQVLSLQTSYYSECGEYQARWDNIFHNSVAPSDIPRTCP